MDERELLDQGLYRHEAMLVEASKNKRFVNYLIDYVMVIIFGMIILGFAAVTGIYDLDAEYFLVDEIVGILAYFGYYLVIENTLRGQSIGKLLTKSRAVGEDGSEVTFKQVLWRSLSRLVPFEQLSFIGEHSKGWHDKWSGTIVIDLKESTL